MFDRGGMAMGKATALDDFLDTRPLTAAEIRERQRAAESGQDVEATPDGQLVTRRGASEVQRVVLQAPQQTWD